MKSLIGRPEAAAGLPARGPVVVSASRRTDIPALYGEWLRRRLDAGWCEVRHPFTGRLRRVSLAPDDVLGWVFWSRHYAPFLGVLDGLHARGDRFVCHLTVTGLPRQFEPRGPAVEAALAGGLEVAERFGPGVLQWRYDPVLLSDATPPEWHLENFARLAARFEGATRRCIFSFPTMYARARRNLAGLQVWQADTGEVCGAGVSPAGEVCGAGVPPALGRPPGSGGRFTDADLERLAAGLAALARERGMALEVCCGEEWATAEAGIGKARCVDWPLLKSLGPGAAGTTNVRPPEPKLPARPMRPGCGCYASVDIGRYETCSHGCAYCYAVQTPARALANRAAHDPDAAAL